MSFIENFNNLLLWNSLVEWTIILFVVSSYGSLPTLFKLWKSLLLVLNVCDDAVICTELRTHSDFHSHLLYFNLNLLNKGYTYEQNKLQTMYNIIYLNDTCWDQLLIENSPNTDIFLSSTVSYNRPHFNVKWVFGTWKSVLYRRVYRKIEFRIMV